MDPKLFKQALAKAAGMQQKRHGIGTLSEKTVHAVLKHYYAPQEDMHEIPVNNYVADIYTGGEIIEIQTRNFDKLPKKLDAFLPLCIVTVVYPIPHKKWLAWIDEESGECTSKRKSPKTGNACDAFRELRKIKDYLKDPHLRIVLALLDMEEYRLLNGWSRDRKRGSTRYDRIPTELVEEIRIERIEDYMQFLPPSLPERFTAAEFAKEAHIRIERAQDVLYVLYFIGLLERIGKKGRSYLYKIGSSVPKA